jgi:hypothetical protein
MAIKINSYDVLDQLCARKPGEWSDIPFLSEKSVTAAQKKYLKGLPVLAIGSQYQPLFDYERTEEVKAAIAKGTRFLAVNEKNEVFYVYTSGYNYFRYALRVDLGSSAPAYSPDLPRLYSLIVRAEDVADCHFPSAPPADSFAEPQKHPWPNAWAAAPDVKRLILASEILVKYIQLQESKGTILALAEEVEDAIKELNR